MENPNPFCCGYARARTRRKDRTEITVLMPPSTTHTAAAPALAWLLKAAAAFIRYFSFRMVVEDLDALTKLEGAKLFAGVPHGLWPVGVALLGYCWWFLPFGLIRAGTASIVLRLPVWRQVTLWNGGIPVDRHSLWRALMKGDNCLVAADGISRTIVSSRASSSNVTSNAAPTASRRRRSSSPPRRDLAVWFSVSKCDRPIR